MLYQLWSTQTSIRLNCTELRNVSDASQISGTLSADVCSPVSISGFFSLTIRLRMKVFLNLQSFVLRTKKDFYFDAIFYFHFCLFGFKMLPFFGGGVRMRIILNLQSFVLRTKKDFYFDAIFFFHFCLFGFKMLPFFWGGYV